MSLLELMKGLPMDRFLMLMGLLLAVIGIIPFAIGALIIISSPVNLTAGLTMVTAGGTLIGLSVVIVKAVTNGDTMKRLDAKIDGIVPCLKPSGEPKCMYEGEPIKSDQVAGFPVKSQGV